MKITNNIEGIEIMTPAGKAAQFLREQIRSGRLGVGERLGPERDLAEQFKISRGTVRQALKLLEKERLIVSQQGRGTFVSTPAFSAETETQTPMLGVLVYEKEYYFGAVLQPASRHSSTRGYMLTTGSNETEEAESQHIEAFLRWGIRGVIMAPHPAGFSIKAYDRLIEKKVPVVLLDTLLADREEDFVSVDNRKGTILAVRHLVELGHKRIAYIGHCDSPDLPCRPDRRGGFLDACKNHGLSLPEEWCIETSYNDSAARIQGILKSENRPTAFVTYSDHWAITVIKAAREMGLKVPTDLSVVGFDKSFFGRNYDVPLTTIDPRPEELARAAVNLLVEKIENPPDWSKYSLLVTPRLVVRDSTCQDGG
jgi:GntR family transcriptional regulator, arabinose operon transcriptional repressor